MTGDIWIGVLGPWEIRVGGRTVLVPRGQQRIFLASLLIALPDPVTVPVLVERGWPERQPANAISTLHTYATRLRKALGPGLIDFERGTGYVLRLPPSSVDLHQFSALLAAAAAAARPQDELAALTEALGLWRGQAFGDEPSTWLDHEVVPKLTEQWFAATERKIDLELASGGPAAAIPVLRGLTVQFPTRESLWAQLITALHQSGRRADALEAYGRLRTNLREEHGLDPSRRLADLQRAVLLGDQGHPAPPVVEVASARPRQLPHDLRTVVGREAELASMAAGLARTPKHVPTLIAIDGAAGTGKTTLAVHWAHRIADRYPDAQLYVNLRGYGPGEPMAPAAAIEILLRGLGVDSVRIPPNLDERSAMLRTELSSRRALILLDNARDANQVRPLLPGSECLVVVTSRNQLLGLAVRDGAQRMSLGRLAPEPAINLLATAVGAQRVAAEPDAAAALVALSDHLPLAVAIVAERVNRNERIDTVVAELADESARLDGLGIGADDPQTDVRAALASSYASLPTPAAEMLRGLGVHPAGDIAVETAAALADVSVPAAKAALEQLLVAHLVEQRRQGRYEMHDLIRLYAAGLATDGDAVGRVLDFYLHSAVNADTRLHPHRRRAFVEPYEPKVEPRSFQDAAQATAWFEVEYENLRQVVLWAGAHGWGGHAWRTAIAMRTFIYNRIPWHDGLEFYSEVLDSCGDDAVGEAHTLNSVGCLHLDLCDPDAAEPYLRRAAERFGSAGDRLGEAMVWGNLSLVHATRSEHADAFAYGRRAVQVFEQSDDRRSTALNFDNLGMAYHGAGEHTTAIAMLKQALTIYEQLGEHTVSPVCRHNLGTVYAAIGNHRAAVRACREAITAFVTSGDHRSEARVRLDLGRFLTAAGHPQLGREMTQAAEQTLAAYADPRDKAIIANTP
jgi:DNA-binding SARP family transcriptional activator/tetratricopeptide (TPR) repeat protein